MFQRLASWLAVLGVVFGTHGTASAGGPQVERIAGHAAFAKGTLENLSLDDEGVVRTGPAFDALPLDAATAWTALQTDDVLWIGTGNDAVLLRVKGNEKPARIDVGRGLMVTALAPLPDGAVAAAVFPGGRIMKVAADGKAALHATLPVEHVWALQAGRRGALTAACGVPGSLFRVDPFGAVEKIVDVDDEHARCLAAGNGKIYVGTAPKGRVLALEGTKLRVVRDLEPKEVVGIVPFEDGSLIVAANADQAGGNAQTLATLLRQMTRPPETKPGVKAPPRAALQDGLIYHLEPNGVLTPLWAAKKTAVLTLARSGEGAVAGTYPSGRVIRVEPGAAATLLADLPEAEASVVVGGRSTQGVVTSNPAVLHRRTQGPSARKGAWTSAPLDAGAPSRWGRVSLRGEGALALHARHGETAEPDGSWSGWRAVGGFDGRAGSLGVLARFVQVRIGLTGDDATLRAIEIVRRTPNRAPVLGPVTVTKPKTKSENGDPAPATPVRTIGWKVADADKDRLRTTLDVNREGSPHWTTLVDGEVLGKPGHTWDTTGMPDGTYRVRVSVDDGPDNAAGRRRSAQRVLTGLRVDNTPPRVRVEARRHAGNRIRIEGQAEDPNEGRIASVRVSIDGGPWQPLAASDGLFDTGREAFASVVRVTKRSAYDIVVQVRDAEGNVGTAAAVVR